MQKLFMTATTIPLLALMHPKAKDFVEGKLYKPMRTKKEFFEPFTVEERLNKELRTGDLVLTKRRLSPVRPYTTLMRLLSRKSLQGDYDHVGVIIFNEEKDCPYVLEFDMDKIKYIPFEEKIINSIDKKLVVRFLKEKAFDRSKLENVDCFLRQLNPKFSSISLDNYQNQSESHKNDKITLKNTKTDSNIEKDAELDKKAAELANVDKKGKDSGWLKGDTLTSLYYSTPQSVDKHYSIYHIFCQVRNTKWLKDVCHRAVMRKCDDEEFEQIVDVADKALKDHRKKVLEKDRKFEDEKTVERRFASPTLVARTYQILGLLPPEINAKRYNVDNFSGITTKSYRQLKLSALPLIDNTDLDSVTHFINKK